jgi:hypothetical protein
MRPGQLLTAERLEEMGACDEAVRHFRRRWPKGVRLSRKFFRAVAASRAPAFREALGWFRLHPQLFSCSQYDGFAHVWTGREGCGEADAMWAGLKAGKD